MIEARHAPDAAHVRTAPHFFPGLPQLAPQTLATVHLFSLTGLVTGD
jgi:hypothetical protein